MLTSFTGRNCRVENSLGLLVLSAYSPVRLVVGWYECSAGGSQAMPFSCSVKGVLLSIECKSQLWAVATRLV